MVMQTRVIAKGTYTEEDKKALQPLFQRYMKAIRRTDAQSWLDNVFWKDVEKGKTLAIMAMDEKNRPLGFRTLDIFGSGASKALWATDYYTVKERRRESIGLGLAKKAFFVSRMINAKKFNPGHSITREGKALLEKVQKRQADWNKIPKNRFTSFRALLAEQRRKRFK